MQVKHNLISSIKTFLYRSPNWSSCNLKFRILGNLKILSKYWIWVKTSSARSRNESFAIAVKNYTKPFKLSWFLYLGPLIFPSVVGKTFNESFQRLRQTYKKSFQMSKIRKILFVIPKYLPRCKAYIRRSENVLNVFWASYVRSIYDLCPWGMQFMVIFN